MAPQQNIKDVLKFWFEDHGPAVWFSHSEELDALIRERFSGLHALAIAGKLSEWRNTSEGRLVEIIILDQFSRNMFRGNAKAFAWDKLALELSKQAIQKGDDKKLPPTMRAFLYVPFMHSERLEDHDVALTLYKALGEEENFKFELLHKDIIERFGRYPHRNKALGRTSTQEEKAFLDDPNEPFKG